MRSATLVPMTSSGTWLGNARAALLRSWRFRVWASVAIAVAGVCAFVPLFWVLGFEFAFAMAIIGSLAGLDLGIHLVRATRRAGASATARSLYPLPMVFGLWLRAAGLAALALVPPLILISANALRIRNCDFGFGMHAYLAVPLVSAVLAAGIGVAAGLVIGRGQRVLASAAPYLIVAASALYSIFRFYAAPPVFSYNLFVGYFPGNLYDEAIELGGAFYWARLYQLGLVVSMLAVGAVLLDTPAARLVLRGRRRPDGWRLAPLMLAVAALASTAALRQSSGPLGFDIDAADIEIELAGRHETEHFVIYYNGGTQIADYIELIGEDHEFRLAQIVRDLEVAPPKKITSFLFADPGQKYRLMGARNIYMAKPWRREIYLNHSSFPHQVLRHEIAHVVAGGFGDPMFGVSASGVFGLPLRFNVGLIEGLAVAVDWPDHFTRELTPHQSVKALTQLGMAPPLSGLLSTGFLAVSSARSYTVAGSFVRFLWDRYGVEKVKALYRSGGDFPRVYGKSLGALEAEWREMIDATGLPEGAAEMIRERFRHRSIFQRACPHAVARARQQVDELIARGDLDGAIDKMRDVCDDVPGEPRYLMELGALLVRGDRLEHHAEADAIYAALAADVEEVSSSIRVRALLRRAELAMARGQREEALELVAEAAALPVPDDLARLAQLELWAGRSPGPAGPYFRRYFWGDPPGRGNDPVAGIGRAAQALAAEPRSAYAHYLVGFNLRHRNAHADSAEALSTALDLGLESPLVRREAARLLAEAAYIAGDYDAVERAAAILAEPDQPAVMRLYGADWIERVHWKRTGKLP